MSEQKKEHTGNKYHRTIMSLAGNSAIGCPVDVYCVLKAFEVTCPARQHAIKKLLCAGLRGKGSELQDLREAGDAVIRAVEMQQE